MVLAPAYGQAGTQGAAGPTGPAGASGQYAATYADRAAAAAASVGSIIGSHVLVQSASGHTYPYLVQASGTETADGSVVIDATGGQLSLRHNGRVRPEVFGAISDATTDSGTELQAFFDWCRDSDVHGDWSGRWVTSTALTIEGNQHNTYTCGSVHASADLPVVLSIECTNASLRGKLEVYGTGGTTYSTRGCDVLVAFADSSRTSLDSIIVAYAVKWGVLIDGTGSNNSTMTRVGHIKATSCGSADNSTRALEVAYSACSNNGSAGSAAQDATLTIASIPSEWEVNDIIEVDGRVHSIQAINAGDIEVFPWLTAAAISAGSGTITSLHGGCLKISGNDAASCDFRQVDAIGCGSGVWCASLYGSVFGSVQTQFCGAGLMLGSDINSNNLGTALQHLYCENNSWDYVQLTRVDVEAFIATSPTLDFAETCVVGAPIEATQLPDQALSRIAPVFTNKGVILQRSGNSSRGSTASTRKLSNLPPRHEGSQRRAFQTLYLEWDEDANRNFGRDTITFHAFGTASTDAPTSVTIEPTSVDATAGITVNGGASLVLSSLSGPVYIVAIYDYANEDWRVRYTELI